MLDWGRKCLISIEAIYHIQQSHSGCKYSLQCFLEKGKGENGSLEQIKWSIVIFGALYYSVDFFEEKIKLVSFKYVVENGVYLDVC